MVTGVFSALTPVSSRDPRSRWFLILASAPFDPTLEVGAFSLLFRDLQRGFGFCLCRRFCLRSKVAARGVQDFVDLACGNHDTTILRDACDPSRIQLAIRPTLRFVEELGEFQGGIGQSFFGHGMRIGFKSRMSAVVGLTHPVSVSIQIQEDEVLSRFIFWFGK